MKCLPVLITLLLLHTAKGIFNISHTPHFLTRSKKYVRKVNYRAFLNSGRMGSESNFHTHIAWSEVHIVAKSAGRASIHTGRGKALQMGKTFRTSYNQLSPPGFKTHVNGNGSVLSVEGHTTTLDCKDPFIKLSYRKFNVSCDQETSEGLLLFVGRQISFPCIGCVTESFLCFRYSRQRTVPHCPL